MQQYVSAEFSVPVATKSHHKKICQLVYMCHLPGYHLFCIWHGPKGSKSFLAHTFFFPRAIRKGSVQIGILPRIVSMLYAPCGEILCWKNKSQQRHRSKYGFPTQTPMLASPCCFKTAETHPTKSQAGSTYIFILNIFLDMDTTCGVVFSGALPTAHRPGFAISSQLHLTQLA